jgi:hypothetical protein
MKFTEAARELGCDEDEARFDATLRNVARHKPVKDAKPEPEKPDDGK